MWLDPNEVDPAAIAWLNDNVLMGFTADHGKWAGQPYTMVDPDGNMTPWFATPDYQGGYTEEVPLDAVMHLFRHHVVESPVFGYIKCDDLDTVIQSGGYFEDITDDDGEVIGSQGYRKVIDPTRKGIIHPETGEWFNVRKARYGIHQFDEWLVNNVAVLLDDSGEELQVGSAMLLSGGAVAAVSVELPETIETKAGFPIRPRLLAYTSHDSSFQTTYMRSLLSPVCDNSLSIEIRRDKGSEHQQKWTSKHTVASTLRIGSARDALAIMYSQSDEMVAAVEELSQWDVTNDQFRKLMNDLHPVPEVRLHEEGPRRGQIANQREINNAENKRTGITTLYIKDERVAPWRGTALGVLQAYNTYNQHDRGVKAKQDGGTLERQWIETLADDVTKFNASVLNRLAEVCDREKVAV